MAFAWRDTDDRCARRILVCSDGIGHTALATSNAAHCANRSSSGLRQRQRLAPSRPIFFWLRLRLGVAHFDIGQGIRFVGIFTDQSVPVPTKPPSKLGG